MLDAQALAPLVNAGLSDQEIADKVGVSSRTVLRWRQRYGFPSKWTPLRAPHGTNSRYNAGCRCQDCRAAHTAYHAVFVRRLNLATIPTAIRAYAPWTPTEDAVVLAHTPARAAQLLERSWSACAQRRTILRAREAADLY